MQYNYNHVPKIKRKEVEKQFIKKCYQLLPVGVNSGCVCVCNTDSSCVLLYMPFIFLIMEGIQNIQFANVLPSPDSCCYHYYCILGALYKRLCFLEFFFHLSVKLSHHLSPSQCFSNLNVSTDHMGI